MGTRSADRRFWLRFDVAMASLGVLIVVESESLAERIAYVAFTGFWIVEAVYKAGNIQRHGRWIDAPVPDSRTRTQLALAWALSILFVVGVVIGLT